MKKKYTIEEFKMLFDEVKMKTIEELQKLIDEKLIDDETSLLPLALGLQNIIAIDTLEKNLFK